MFTISSPQNGGNVSIGQGFTQVMGSVDFSSTITACINDGGTVQCSPPQHVVVPPGATVPWTAIVPTSGFHVGDWALLTASAKADDGTGTTSMTINIHLVA